MIYFDNAATTQVDPRVTEEMKEYLTNSYGNPSSKYYTYSVRAREAVERSRKQVARLLNCNPEEVIFTSGATEGNNFVLKSLIDYNDLSSNHLVTSTIEHDSVLKACEFLKKIGCKISFIKANEDGTIDIKELKYFLLERPLLTSIAWVNNELGVENDIGLISKLCAENNTYFHTDATQAIGKKKIDLSKFDIDFLTASGHKIHGPKGVGFVYLRKSSFLNKQLKPLIHGGEQEFGFRSGTLPVHNIVGLGKAIEIHINEFENSIAKIRSLTEYFEKKLNSNVENLKINGERRVPGILNITIPNLNNELLIRKLKESVAISTGSACSMTEPSHVLKSIGFTQDKIQNTVRISLSKYNKEEEIDFFIEKLANIISDYVW